MHEGQDLKNSRSCKNIKGLFHVLSTFYFDALNPSIEDDVSVELLDLLLLKSKILNYFGHDEQVISQLRDVSLDFWSRELQQSVPEFASLVYHEIEAYLQQGLLFLAERLLHRQEPTRDLMKNDTDTSSNSLKYKYLRGLFLMKKIQFKDASTVFNELLGQQLVQTDEEFQKKIFYQLARIHLYLGKHDQSISFLQKFLSMQGKESCWLLPEVYLVKGYAELSRDRLEDAVASFECALRFAREMNHDLLVAFNLMGLGECARREGRLEDALDCYQNSLDILGRFGGHHSTNLHNGIGIILFEQGKLSEAKKHFLKETRLQQSLGNRHKMFHSLLNVGIVDMMTDKLDVARETFLECLKIAEELDIDSYRYKIFLNMGIIYKREGNLTTAMSYYEEASVMAKRLSLNDDLAKIYHNIGNIHELKGELSKALQFHQKALELRKKIGNPKELAHSYLALAMIQRQSGHPHEARTLAGKSLEIFKEMNHSLMVATSLHQLLLIAIDMNDDQMARGVYRELQQVYWQHPDSSIRLIKMHAQAILLKHSRLGDDQIDLFELGVLLLRKSKSLQILTTLIKDPDNRNLELKMNAIMHVCELLLLRYQLFRDEEDLFSLDAYFSELEEIARSQYLHPILVKVYWLKSKLSLLQGRHGESQIFFQEALELARSKDLNILHRLIRNEELKSELATHYQEVQEMTDEAFSVQVLLKMEKILKAISSEKFYLMASQSFRLKELEVQEAIQMSQLLKKKFDRPFFG